MSILRESNSQITSQRLRICGPRWARRWWRFNVTHTRLDKRDQEECTLELLSSALAAEERAVIWVRGSSCWTLLRGCASPHTLSGQKRDRSGRKLCELDVFRLEEANKSCALVGRRRRHRLHVATGTLLTGLHKIAEPPPSRLDITTANQIRRCTCAHTDARPGERMRNKPKERVVSK
jgi:hypothetical protein